MKSSLLGVSRCKCSPTASGRFLNFGVITLAATDKVALLIGNMNYRHHTQLCAPIADVHELTNLLRQMDFKVVSLLDLNWQEMHSAVTEFLLLLDKGVYGMSSTKAQKTWYFIHLFAAPSKNAILFLEVCGTFFERWPVSKKITNSDWGFSNERGIVFRPNFIVSRHTANTKEYELNTYTFTLSTGL